MIVSTSQLSDWFQTRITQKLLVRLIEDVFSATVTVKYTGHKVGRSALSITYDGRTMTMKKLNQKVMKNLI